jgi:glycosyltransferase involved in cell wall biosynthesis
MRVAYVTSDDPRDIRVWSGLPYHLLKEFERADLDVTAIGPLAGRGSGRYVARKAVAKLQRRKYLQERDPSLLRLYAAQARSKLEHTEYDVVLSTSTLPVAFLDVPRPIITWTDSTFAQMVDFYPGFTGLTPRSLNDGNLVEASAFERVALSIFQSQWAASSAIRDYGADPARVAVIPYGANLEGDPDQAAVEAAVDERGDALCQLLWVGVEWERKGGDVALDIVRRLNEIGVAAHLAVVGCNPEIPDDLRQHVNVVGFLNKAESESRGRLAQLYDAAHFLVHPARAECSALVLAEAYAHGVPCLASSVGGMPEIIVPGKTGQLFPAGGQADPYVSFIRKTLSRPGAYRELANSVFKEYRRKLNWTTSINRLRQELDRLMPSPQNHPQ